MSPRRHSKWMALLMQSHNPKIKGFEASHSFEVHIQQMNSSFILFYFRWKILSDLQVLYEFNRLYELHDLLYSDVGLPDPEAIPLFQLVLLTRRQVYPLLQLSPPSQSHPHLLVLLKQFHLMRVWPKFQQSFKGLAFVLQMFNHFEFCTDRVEAEEVLGAFSQLLVLVPLPPLLLCLVVEQTLHVRLPALALQSIIYHMTQKVHLLLSASAQLDYYYFIKGKQQDLPLHSPQARDSLLPSIIQQFSNNQQFQPHDFLQSMEGKAIQKSPSKEWQLNYYIKSALKLLQTFPHRNFSQVTQPMLVYLSQREERDLKKGFEKQELIKQGVRSNHKLITARPQDLSQRVMAQHKSEGITDKKISKLKIIFQQYAKSNYAEGNSFQNIEFNCNILTLPKLIGLLKSKLGQSYAKAFRGKDIISLFNKHCENRVLSFQQFLQLAKEVALILFPDQQARLQRLINQLSTEYTLPPLQSQKRNTLYPHSGKLESDIKEEMISRKLKRDKRLSKNLSLNFIGSTPELI